MIRIVTDSTCDLTLKQYKDMDISFVPLTISFSEEEFKDGIDLTTEEFYMRLRAAEMLPRTSRANPAQFYEVLAPMVAAGDDIIIITMASGLSSTAQSALIAAQAFETDRIHIVDGGSVSLGTVLLLQHAVRMRDEGKLTAKEIADKIGELADRMELYAIVDTLKYLKMGGRISGGEAFVGGVLSIKPVIRIVKGQLDVIGKVRGEAAAMREAEKIIFERSPDMSLGMAFANADAEERMDKYIQKLEPVLGDAELITGSIGAVIGTHGGPGVVGFAFFV